MVDTREGKNEEGGRKKGGEGRREKEESQGHRLLPQRMGAT